MGVRCSLPSLTCLAALLKAERTSPPHLLKSDQGAAHVNPPANFFKLSTSIGASPFHFADGEACTIRQPLGHAAN